MKRWSNVTLKADSRWPKQVQYANTQTHYSPTLWFQPHRHRSMSRSVWPRWMTHPTPECHGWRPWLNNYDLPVRQRDAGNGERERRVTARRRERHRLRVKCMWRSIWVRKRLFQTLFGPLNNFFKQEDHSKRQQGLNNKGVRIWVVPLGKTINTFEL